LEGEKRLRRDPAARSRSAAQAEEAGWKALWGREGAKPLGPLYAASAAITRVRDGSRMAETPPYRRLGADPESPAPEGETLNYCAFGLLNLIQEAHLTRV
jgi:hypothetical protein